ncbi:MAG: hypothetical protein M3198_00875 [Actinomycetota bacterium]|nr:hypothetical protein [Actinomycetota bacterium]
MPKITERLDDVRSRAVELYVYLPLGAYSRVRDSITDLNRRRLNKLFDDLIDRGQERLQPIEKAVRRRSNDVQDTVEETAKTVTKDAQKAVRKTTKRATAASAAVAPKMPRVAAPKSAGELAISGYDSLTAADIVSRLQGLTQTDLARIYKYEQTNDGRSTILEAIDSRLIDLPIATYDALTVDEISSRLDGLSKSDIRTLRRYEAESKARSTLLEKYDSLL